MFGGTPASVVSVGARRMRCWMRVIWLLWSLSRSPIWIHRSLDGVVCGVGIPLAGRFPPVLLGFPPWAAPPWAAPLLPLGGIPFGRLPCFPLGGSPCGGSPASLGRLPGIP